ncbi:MAG: threonine/serine exporter family protein [Candidatus Cloacimonetes bacterium]|nr:threonine/serine exporter family protein [Candidatus Cloacimonadota bacterium]MDD3143217.1 threonine/serine exporter family protein [Candidatus Cloacimonadota bacterium]MDY0367649.1 threonine/serine exporter family protein [Candidatus Syntrophosphaera sp.]HOY84725.1 threonine/serine exporter family protein [Candidatus Syntrophosphaera sp.]HPH60242.1 threonine/serine exporter family protein [Candidatus Syntrophosphaera sp.]
MTAINIKEATEISLEIGRMLLQSGATTNRVERMMRKVSEVFGYQHTEAYVTPTGIFISVSDSQTQLNTSIRRIENRRTDLGKITRVSHLVSELEQQSCREGQCRLSAADFMRKLAEIDNAKDYPAWFTVFCGGLTSGCFCLLFGGSWAEFAVAYAVGILVSLALRLLGLLQINNFLLNILGAALVVTFAKLIDLGVPNIALDNIIIGGIMLLVPGLSFVNAIRDTMSGDLVSGTARAVEAVFIAVAIAAGSGVMLKLWELWGY